jgi:hypothetical protein
MHAQMALQALKAGKHVLVEKPLALDAAELATLTGGFRQTARRELPVLMTGFNRRFSPYGRRISDLVRERTNPMILNYRMNAGYIPLDHSLHGGRAAAIAAKPATSTTSSRSSPAPGWRRSRCRRFVRRPVTTARKTTSS